MALTISAQYFRNCRRHPRTVAEQIGNLQKNLELLRAYAGTSIKNKQYFLPSS